MAGQQSIKTKAQAAEQVVRCPRCGYDQRGTLETWFDSCPLQGQCAECGLVIDWGRVLNMARHPWLFEYHWRHQPLRRLAQTIFRVVTPRRFWRDVSLHDPIYPRPVATVALMLLAVALVIAFVGQVLEFFQWAQLGYGTSTPSAWLKLQSAFEWAWRRLFRQEVDHLIGPIVVVVSMPFVFGLIPMTLRGARVRRHHIIRIGLFSAVGALMFFLFHTCLTNVLGILEFKTLSRAITPWEWRWLGTWNATWVDELIGALVSTVLVSDWIWWWWACACNHYLRLQRPWRTAAVLTGIGLLLAVNAQAWYSLTDFWN